MVEDNRADLADAGRSAGGDAADPGRERHMTSGPKRDAVLRLLRSEPLEIVARDLSVTAADLDTRKNLPAVASV